MASVRDVRRVALSLPEVEEIPHFDRPSFRVRGKILAVVKPDNRMFIKASPDEQQALVAARPEVYELNDGLQVRLPPLSVTELRELVVDAWALVAPKRLAKEHPHL